VACWLSSGADADADADAVPAEGTRSFTGDPDGFRPFNATFSDDYLFLTDTLRRLRAYAFSADGGMPERVRELNDLKEPRGMAFHKSTGTLLVACSDGSGRGVQGGVELLDTRPPPSDWSLPF
jgi:hypothetical protein